MAPLPPPPEPATRERLSVRRASVLCSIFFGASVTEAVSVNLLPRTLDLFTQNPVAIFCILAINPAFGFIAQPLVGLVSDQTWTRFGRRAVFLLTAGPVVAVSLLLIPWLGSFGVLVLTIVVLQFFQDVVNGSDQPLLADLVAPEQRTFALGLVKAAENAGFLLVLFVGMRLVENWSRTHGEQLYGWPLYLAAAVCQIVFVALAALFLDEQPIARQPRPQLTWRRYLNDFLHQPMLPRIAAAYFVRAFARTAVVGSASLYAYRTLHLSVQEFGASWGWLPFIALATGVPLGLVAERFAKHRILQLAFLILIVGCGAGYLVRDQNGLLLTALVFGTGDMLLEVTHKAYMSDHYPADLVGQLAGAVNCFYAAGRTVALVVVGVVVRVTNPDIDWAHVSNDTAIDYSSIWMISAGAALAGIFLLATTRDLRHEHRRPRSAEGAAGLS